MRDMKVRNTAQILQLHNISEERYAAWAQARFRKQVFYSGLGISALVFLLFSFATYGLYQENPPESFRLYFGIGITCFFTGLFILLAFAMRDEKIAFVNGKFTQPQSFAALGLARMQTIAYMEKLSAKTWQEVEKFSLPQVFPEEKILGYPWSKMFLTKLKKLAWWSLGIFCIVILLVLFWPAQANLPEYLRVVLLVLLGIASLGICLGTLGRIFLHCLNGYVCKSLWLPAIATDLQLSGWFARLCAVLGILLTSCAFLGFLGLVLVLLFL